MTNYGERTEAINACLEEIRAIKWLDNHGEIPAGVRMFDTMGAAYSASYAAFKAVAGGALNAAKDAALEAAKVVFGYAGDAWDAVADAAWDAADAAVREAPTVAVFLDAFDAIDEVAWVASEDATLYAVMVCRDLLIAPEHHEYIRKSWDVWRAGYGVFCDVSGEIYAYRRVI
jgi:hypothetical protein